MCWQQKFGCIAAKEAGCKGTERIACNASTANRVVLLQEGWGYSTSLYCTRGDRLV